jgi:NADH-ubiquinone oxidoreductase chain 5
MIIGLGTNFWGSAIFIHPHNMILPDSEFIPTSVKLIPLFCTLAGCLGSIFVTSSLSSGFFSLVFSVKTSLPVRKAFTFLSKKWYFDQLYNQVVAQSVVAFGYGTTFKLIDKGVIEMLGPFGAAYVVQETSRRASVFQTGYLYHYTFVILMGSASVLLLSSSLLVVDPCMALLLIVYYFFDG